MRILGVTTHHWSPPTQRPNTGRRGKPTVRDLVLKDLATAEKLKAELAQYTHKAIAMRHGLSHRTVNKIGRRAHLQPKPSETESNSSSQISKLVIPSFQDA
jgi:hypothetical protein